MRRLPYLVFLLANLGLILPRAIAQCDVAVTSFTVSASAVVGGSTDTGVGTFTVSIGPNCPSSMGVEVDSSDPDVYVSQTLFYFSAPGGTGTFSYYGVNPVSQTTPVTLRVYFALASAQASQTIEVLPPTISLTLEPSGILCTNQATGTVQLGNPVRATANISLSVTPNVGFFSGLSIPPGQSSGTFTFTPYASCPTSPQSATVTAQYWGVAASAPITIFPSHADLGTCPKHCEDMMGSPINVINGNVWVQQKDYTLPGIGGGLRIARTWNSLWPSNQAPAAAGTFGQGWWSNYEERLTFPGPGTITYWRNDGNYWYLAEGSIPGSYGLLSPPDERATLQYGSGQLTMTFEDGSTRIFNQSGYLLSIGDRNGNQITITYDGSNRIATITDPAGRVLTFNYANSALPNQVSSIQDSVGVIATYTYDANGNLTQVTYADGSFLAMAYDGSNQLTSVTDTNGKVIENHTYDSSRRGLTSQRANGADAISVSYYSGQTGLYDSKNNFSYYGYSYVGGEGLVTSVNGSTCASCAARGNQSFTYDSLGNRTSVKDALGRVTNFTYDSNANMLSRSIQLSSTQTLTWSYTYNSFGEVLTATDPLGNVTTSGYDANGNLLSTTTPSPDGVLPGSTTRFTYDNKGELLTATDPLGNKTAMSYSLAELLASITDAQSNVTRFTYDSRGNRLTTTDALNNVTAFTYDTRNRLTKITYPDSTTTQFGYDIRGRRTSVTDQNGKNTNYAYDDADRLTTVTDAASHITQYGYDTENNLTSIKDALGRTTSFTYDAYGRVTTTTFPSNLQETYSYDAVGNLLSKTDRKSQTIQYAYDALNRLTQKTYPGGGTVSYSYDGDSRVTQVTDATGTYQFTFDNMGRLTGTTSNYAFLAGRSFTTSYGYDAASNRTSIVDPESGSTSYVYDTLNRLQTLTPPTAISSGSFGFGYDALSRRTSLTRPNPVQSSYSYDNLSRLLSVTHTAGGVTLDGATYAVDSAGNRTAKTDLYANLTTNYGYDNIYQLLSATQGSTTAENYTYDAVGNRLSNLAGSGWSNNTSNELISRPGVTYTYDANGNTTSKTDSTGTTNYSWNYDNRLTGVTLPGSGGTVSYRYDPFGRRIYKSSSTGTSVYAYDRDNLVEETNSSGSVVARYSQGPNIDEPLAELRGGATSYYQADGLGSVTTLSNPAGSIVVNYTYDSFGNIVSTSGSLLNNFRYTGREWDSETSLYNYRARYYDQSTGRFVNEDPIHFLGGKNFYSYVSNNPVSRIDPSGLIHQAWGEPPYDGRLHDDAAGGLEVLCKKGRNIQRDKLWLMHSIAVRFVEIVREGDNADLGHINRLVNEAIRLTFCNDTCGNGNEKPEPKPAPDNVNDQNWWQQLQQMLKENPLLRFPVIG